MTINSKNIIANRLKADHDELGDKLKHLDSFLHCGQYKQMGEIEQNLLVSQYVHMGNYHKVLGQRIDMLDDS